MQREAMEARAEELRKMIASAQQEIGSAPEGEIICIRDKTRDRVYCVRYGKRTYINKKDRKRAKALALKKYRKYQVQEWTQELALLEMELRQDKSRSTRTLLKNPIMRELLSDMLNEGIRWAHEAYPSNLAYPEQKIYTSAGGMKVRSKSEWMICSIYERYKIPFRYECALEVGGHTYYPDFTIRHPRTGALYIHEHFGIMDDDHYLDDALNKLRIYVRNGWLPMDRLLITSESLSQPFDIRQMEHMIYGIFVASESETDLMSRN